MWILPALTVLLAFNGGFAQMGDLMRNPLMMRALMNSGSGGSGATDPMTTMMLMNPNMMEGSAANLMMMNALGGGRGGSNNMMNMALMNPEMLSGIMPPSMAGNPAMMYYLLSQNNQEQKPTPTTPAPTTLPGKAGNKNNTANKSSGPDFSQLLQMMALTGGAGSSEMAAMAAMMGGAGRAGPMSPMSVLRPEQYSTLLREGAAAHPQYAQKLCKPLTRCRIPLCTDPIKTYSAKTYFVCPECPKCPHDLMMEMFNPRRPTSAPPTAAPAGKPPRGAAGGRRGNRQQMTGINPLNPAAGLASFV